MSVAIWEDLKREGVLDLGLHLPTEMTSSEYEALGAFLGKALKDLQFAIGDYLLEGERRFGQEAYQLQESLGISAESKAQYVRVSQAIERPRRRQELSWSHHRAVCALGEESQDEWLERAVENQWSKAELEAHLRPMPAISQVVVEHVIQTATVVYTSAVLNGDGYTVPVDPMVSLGEALGL